LLAVLLLLRVGLAGGCAAATFAMEGDRPCELAVSFGFIFVLSGL
jgi:hypothetical protein